MELRVFRSMNRRFGERTLMQAKGLAFALILLLGKSMACGQVLTGEIDGVVRDVAGAAVPNATVTITNIDENLIQRTLKTDAQGQFTAPLLSVGSYSLTVSASGFKTNTMSGIQVHVGQPSEIPVVLSIGQVSED